MFQDDNCKQRTFMMIKPDGVQRNLIGEIISKIEKLNLRLVKLEFKIASQQNFEIHYAHHSKAQYFSSLIKYMTSGPVVLMVWQGFNAIKCVRRKVADKDRNCSCGTIRGDFAAMTGHFHLESGQKKCTKNVCHASDSRQEAQREIKNWFPQLSQRQ